jgi:hypothetical protein
MTTINATEPMPYNLSKRVRVHLGGKQVQWMTLRALRAAVLAGKADNWNVIETIETGEGLLICPACAAGVEHSAAVWHAVEHPLSCPCCVETVH